MKKITKKETFGIEIYTTEFTNKTQGECAKKVKQNIATFASKLKNYIVI